MAVKAAMQDFEVTGFPFFGIELPLVLDVRFFFPNKVGQAYPKKKDIDNMVKYIMDAMTGILYPNDTVVVRLTAEKTFAGEASTSVIIRTWNENNND